MRFRHFSRWFARWINRWHARLNDTGGCATTVGTLIGIALLVIGSAVGQTEALIAGFFLGGACLIYILYAAYAALPPRLNAEQLRNRKLTLGVLSQIREECVTVALVGTGQTGKTTLRELLTGGILTRIHTAEPEMVVVEAPEPVKLLAYLDAAGEDLTQQFEIMDHADFLVLLLDHNESNKDRRASVPRRSE
ncbi:MAG: hypothetical protein L0Z62_25240 [Gemmataceae bacterium]|nr:hypothetical protein [Gemmataceae bacterium]